ncbi:hypothetical protein [Bacteroides cellulosilyticus]|uniref:hypothetical protein n=1 Tax=Bacteroides cellulosilyticus TaxID=246787 RepID=UPI002F96A558
MTRTLQSKTTQELVHLNVPANVVYLLRRQLELKELLTQFTASGAGDNTINLEDDIIWLTAKLGVKSPLGLHRGR